MESIKQAYESGASWIVLCDTNGGTLPYELKNIIESKKNNTRGLYPGSLS